MLLRTRRDVYGIDTNINAEKIWPTSRMVSQLTGLYVQRNKAIVGENAFAHESGIHQDGVLKHRETYEIMDPTVVGIPSNKLVLGKHSGRHALKDRLNELGYSVDEQTLLRVYDAFKQLADKKKNVYDEDIEALVETELESSTAAEMWHLESLQFMAGSDAIPTASVTLSDASGTRMTKAATGDGPVDAIYSAIQLMTGVETSLVDYQLRSVSQGRDAQGEVQVEVDHNGKRVRGRGVSTDVIEASAKAYLSAINRIRSLERRALDASAETSDQPTP
jgi:2-isopropylmalate synthase